ncbi:MAG: bifunctional diaminohydroxyphosphoribosylaminopyrimidine deaminase/5-amino-6-(5-phosphoribosylamino)uracil reductase RibD [Pseudomonadota bacterium]
MEAGDSATDELFLRQAIELAERGRFTCAPNPCVGCLIVRDGVILGRGFHHRTGTGHAEVNAIADAGEDITGATVYISLEPCAFVGRTPACARTLVDKKVKRVVVAAVDPHPRVSGTGLQILRDAGIQVRHIELPEAVELISGYISRVTLGRPLVRLKTAASLDGATALASGESQWITGPEARGDVQYWRARSDAIVTGSGTVREDDPALTVRDAQLQPCEQPLRVVLNGQLSLSADLQVFDGQTPTLLVHAEDTRAPQSWMSRSGVELLPLGASATQPSHLDLPALLAELGQRGCNEVLVEAGATLCGEFVRNGLWDEWLMYVAPKLLGSQSRGLAEFSLDRLAQAPTATIKDVRQVGSDLRIHLFNAHGAESGS